MHLLTGVMFLIQNHKNSCFIFAFGLQVLCVCVIFSTVKAGRCLQKWL